MPNYALVYLLTGLILSALVVSILFGSQLH